MNTQQLFKMEETTDLRIKTSVSSSRKYRNVMWFPRSKTDPHEIREVLKLALKVQEDNPDKYFNDRLLGEHMAKIGSINVVGMQGREYIKSYEGKSIGDKSYVTNARMLMRFFRFLGLVTRTEKSKYRLTDRGELYCQFDGDFPAQKNGENEEQMLLSALADFAFYSVNDSSMYRDASFQIRPFISLLNCLAIEPQCIYQLIVTAFATKFEGPKEIDRIKSILKNLKNGKTTLTEEFKTLGLDANDYSCVHNFYDSAKILVYVGMSLGLIKRTSDPSYGKKITGKARYLKQASTFYALTNKGEEYLEEQIKNRLIYYSDLYRAFGGSGVLRASFVLASLNTVLGSRRVRAIKNTLFDKILGKDWSQYLKLLAEKMQLEFVVEKDWISIKTPVSFNFYQSIPPEFFQDTEFRSWYKLFIEEFIKDKPGLIKIDETHLVDEFTGEVVSRFVLDEEKGHYYEVPNMGMHQADDYIKYPDRDNVFGGQDRFASRISPTNSVLLVGDKVHVDNESDCLDLLVPLRHPDDKLREFISINLSELTKRFLEKSDTWAKDQRYVWIRNCFRQIGAEAIYSGSGGMLSRADVSVVSPFIGGIEAKSPTENRGSVNTKAIRQAFDAKVQVGYKFPKKKDLPRASIAIGRRITPLAIEEEKKYRDDGNPIMLIPDVVLYYLTLKTAELSLTTDDLINIFTKNFGLFDFAAVGSALEKIVAKHGLGSKIQERIKKELSLLVPYVNF